MGVAETPGTFQHADVPVSVAAEAFAAAVAEVAFTAVVAAAAVAGTDKRSGATTHTNAWDSEMEKGICGERS